MKMPWSSPALIGIFQPNQGQNMTGNFKDNAMETLKVAGSAQCIYYMLDKEDALGSIKPTAV